MRTISLSTPRSGLRFGHRSGSKGTHTSRTIMPARSCRRFSMPSRRQVPGATSASAIINDNVTNKKTLATRRVTNQRLRELFGIDPSIAVFRVLRRFWGSDVSGRPLSAQFCSLARDHLLRATGPVVLAVGPGGELSRQELRLAVQDAVGDRLNEATAE